MAPVVLACQQQDEIRATVCVTGQHREMLQQVIDYFGLHADLNLDLMQPNQTLANLTSDCVRGIDQVLAQHQPHCLVAQGDTTTVMAASLAAFYRRIPFVHVEAGLRTGNIWAPWPEELNRRVATLATALHCAPTRRAADNLRAERVPEDAIHVTGNTVVDSLLWTVTRERHRADRWQDKYAQLGQQRLVLITGHRRENFGQGFQDICAAIAALAREFREVQFVYPVHLNPHVKGPVHERLADKANIHLVRPCAYPEFVWLMDRCTLILTDSGGVQEEAPSLKKPVLVMRDTTERPEAVEAGAVELVGTDPRRIVSRVSSLLTDPADYSRHQIDVNPYGDGHAAERIVKAMLEQDWRA